MNFSKTYRRMNEPVGPSPDLIRKTLSHPDRHRLPLRRLAAAAAVAAVLLATPALAVRSETGYAVLYRIAPAVAQFFQPIQEACTDSGITMEVAAVRVEGDTAQAYIVLSGGPVDATTDLFDSWSFHLPFDQTGRCERDSHFSLHCENHGRLPHSHRRQDDLLRPAAADRQEGDGGRDGGPEADELCPRGGDRPHLGG